MPDPMPEHVVPMLAKLSKLPREDGGWAYEIKWDGVRAIAYVRGGEARLESRNLNDVTPRYPEVQGLAHALGEREAVLDGEVVAFDAQGRSSFERLQGRMHLTRGVEARAKQIPVVYCIFDLLWLDGEDLMRLPYAERRERLEALGLDGPAWRGARFRGGEGGGGAELGRRGGRGAARRERRAEPGGDRLQAARLAVRARPPRRHLAEGQEHAPAGARDRRVVGGGGAPCGASRRAAHGLLRGRGPALRRQR